MQIAPEQGAFLTVLTRLVGARSAIEIGTFTGYSALCIARGLPDDGRLTCCDVSEEWTAVGRRAWDAAGVADRIDLSIAPALDTLAAFPAGTAFDLAFIDADKPNYANYFDALLPKMRTNGRDPRRQRPVGRTRHPTRRRRREHCRHPRSTTRSRATTASTR